MEKREVNTVDVAVSMTPDFLERINAHMKRIGMSNRSGFIRAAILSQIVRNIDALREPDEKVY